jgi:four helix bundle protein
MLASKSFDSFPVWQESIAFVKEVYLLTNVFPEEEKQGLVQKLRNASIELSSLISKGLNNIISKKKDNNLGAGVIKIQEIETFLVISHELAFISSRDLERLNEKTENMGRQMNNLLRKLDKEKEIQESQQ